MRRIKAPLNHFSIYRGNDFRELYSEVGVLRSIFPTKTIAMTATVTEEIMQSLQETLCMAEAATVSISPDR
jgi:superfamily II DNA helicase RecQ